MAQSSFIFTPTWYTMRLLEHVTMRRKYFGYILQFTRSDHDGRHIHVFWNDRQVGVFDRIDGPVRGLENIWSRDLEKAIELFLEELNERGY